MERLRQPLARADPASSQAPPPPADPLRAWLQGAGNAATARLARDVSLFAPPSATYSPSDAWKFVQKQDAEAQAKITTYLDAQREGVLAHVVSGWSLPEIVDLVRSNVP